MIGSLWSPGEVQCTIHWGSEEFCSMNPQCYRFCSVEFWTKKVRFESRFDAIFNEPVPDAVVAQCSSRVWME